VPAIDVENVSYQYPSTGFALRDITVQISRQSFLALIGPNGSGKTTLLRLLSNAVQPHGGRILFDGKPLSDVPPRELARQMAVIPSEQYFEFPFRVKDVVAMGRFPHIGRIGRMSAQDWEIVERALRETELDHVKTRAVSELSSGERQRVLVARAIAQSPAVLLLDEPNAHLDINHQISIFRLLRSLHEKRGITVVVVIHDLTAAAAFCKSVILLHLGKIVKSGIPEEVITTDMIRQTYGADVMVFPSPLGGFPQVTYQGFNREGAKARID
jgi:iron complex transport system ATP-binding protein